MRTRRIHVMGASGAGVTTLGRALADALAIPHHDTDDYYWLPTTPPFRHKRPPADRLRLMQEMFIGRPAWVLSGAFGEWGDTLIPLLDLVVFLYAPTAVRLARLREREERREGAGLDSPGGLSRAEVEDFLDWAAHYDHGTREGRSLPRHQQWLAALPCPVLRLDGTRPAAELVAATLARPEVRP